MKEYMLTEEEKTVLNEFCNHSIPYIFRSGEYCGYMRYFEEIDFEVCYGLLKGRRIQKQIYQWVMYGDDINKEKLDSNALEYYNLYLLVANIIIKKYRMMVFNQQNKFNRKKLKKKIKGDAFANKNLFELLSLYCNNDIEKLKSSELYIELQKIIDELKYAIVCEYGKEPYNEGSENLYLSITILNDKNEEIEILDKGFLTASTLLVFADKKYKYRFFSWNDNEFIEDLNWIIKELENIKK